MLSVTFGKEGAAKLSETTKKWKEETTKKLAETSQKVAHTVKEVKERKWADSDKSPDKARKSTVPKPDDFFTDFGGDDFPTPAKLKEAKKAGATFDDDFDFPAPAKPVGSKKAPSISADSVLQPTASQAGQPAPSESDDTAERAPHTWGDDGAASVWSAPDGEQANNAPAATDGWDDDARMPSPGGGGDGWGEELQLPTDVIADDLIQTAHAAESHAGEIPGGAKRHDSSSDQVSQDETTATLLY